MSEAQPDLLRRATTEAIGTFMLVVAGCGALITDARYDGALGAVGVSLVFGLVIMIPLSGAVLGALAYQYVRGEDPAPPSLGSGRREG